jgi:hypothetical protein
MNQALREATGAEYHEHEAARFRRLAATATTPAMKDRLLMQAEEHEQLASGEAEPATAEIP